MSKYAVVIMNGTREQLNNWKSLPDYDELGSFMDFLRDAGLPILHATAIKEEHLTPIRNAGEGIVESFSLHHDADMISGFQFPPTVPCIPEWTKVTPPISPEEIYRKTGKTSDSLLWDRLFSSDSKSVRLLFDKGVRYNQKSIDYTSERLDAVLRCWKSEDITSLVIFGVGVQSFADYINDHGSDKVDFDVIPVEGLVCEENPETKAYTHNGKSLEDFTSILEAYSIKEPVHDVKPGPSRIIT